MQTHAGQPGPRRPTVSFQSGRKERTQRSPTRGPRTQCGPSKPPRTCGAISASLEGSPSRASTAPHVSASLEGSEPILGGVDRLLLARGWEAYPRGSGSPPPHSRPPLDGKDKRPFRSPAHHTEALKANHSSTMPGSDDVWPPLRTVAVTGVPSANSGHFSVIPGTVATL